MSTLDDVRDDFTHGVRQRGRDYYRRGAVRVTHADDRSMRAQVRGTRLYAVRIEWDRSGQNLTYSCTCPYGDDSGEPCKHIWATMLAGDSSGQLPDSSHGLDDIEDGVTDEETVADYQNIGKMSGQEIIMLTNLRAHRREGRRAPAPPAPPQWKRKLNDLRSMMQSHTIRRPEPWPAEREIAYVFDGPETVFSGQLTMELAYRAQRKTGAGWDRPKQLKLSRNQIPLLPDPIDRQLVQMLAGAGRDEYGYSYYDVDLPRRYRLTESAFDPLVKMICQTGRCRLRKHQGEQETAVIGWDDGGTWEFVVRVVPGEEGQYRLEGSLRRGEDQMTLTEADLLVSGGLVFAKGKVAPLNDHGAFEIIRHLRSGQDVAVPVAQADELIAELLRLPRVPKLDLPESLALTELRPSPKVRLKVQPPKRGYGDDRLRGELSFDYEGQVVPYATTSAVIFEPDQRRVLYRDTAAEWTAVGRLTTLGFRTDFDYGGNAPIFKLTPKNLPRAVRALTAEGWNIEVDGKAYRQPGEIKIEVKSGIDWFDLHAAVDFGGQTVALPKLLAALRRGETTIALDDGTLGIMPEEWLKKYGLLASVGTAEGETIRFGKNQVGLLDALLAAQPQVSFDEAFGRAREALQQFEGISAADAPESFVGVLRPYQREGLGWLRFLAKFGLGGCLADDMGLGKTIQVLAMLEERRRQREAESAGGDESGQKQAPPSASLIVVPRSLVFNWKQEASKFTPALKVLDHTSGLRKKEIDHFKEYDVVLTTYGTLRNDARLMKDVRFDYVILDEAQAIKNAASESAKAARLLRGQHRLALSGTPVQNHLGELWSLFEFLNPGMLGGASTLAPASNGKAMDPDSRALLARALRPFILRRTKEQVAKDLPEKLEQTIFCELEKPQRKLYDELRNHYRQSLLSRIEQEGMGKAKIQVLEALLRLRQAACHPGLIDKAKVGEGSAKLDTLLAHLSEVADEGHKVLVFSQFTSMLAIVRQRLDAEKVVYEYLDGKTKDRQAKVERFQSDADCKLFLISLKAGGVGLNLTAAQYVFLLDPWWNPAVEAQAIDRAHRIGQTKGVFAYRLIAKDTVEEKVLQLQQSKRDLADAIITADNSLLAKLGREELELLLS